MGQLRYCKYCKGDTWHIIFKEQQQCRMCGKGNKKDANSQQSVEGIK